YSSFFFLAFVAANLHSSEGAAQGHRGECGAPTCMTPLAINLAIIFGVRLFLNNFLDVLLPCLAHRHKVQRETGGVQAMQGAGGVQAAALSPAERDYMLMDYDGLVEGINNYADLSIQVGV
ncbi:hypothetical protein B484DRAFT_411028, partial [Ochromonadaceae sp. CCMP2298]